MEIFGVDIDSFLIEQGIFILLFVWLFFDSRNEAKRREDKLMTQINEQNSIQGRIVETLERLEEKINNIIGGR